MKTFFLVWLQGRVEEVTGAGVGLGSNGRSCHQCQSGTFCPEPNRVDPAHHVVEFRPHPEGTSERDSNWPSHTAEPQLKPCSLACPTALPLGLRLWLLLSKPGPQCTRRRPLGLEALPSQLRSTDRLFPVVGSPSLTCSVRSGSFGGGKLVGRSYWVPEPLC